MDTSVISADNAKAAVLGLFKKYDGTAETERFVVQSCEPSPRGDYWVVTANSEDYVVRGMLERCYVGVSAHLVDVESGEITTVGSGEGWQVYLQDKYVAEIAGSNFYVLRPTFSRSDKRSLINLRHKLACRLQDAIFMTSPEGSIWFTGSRRTLINAQLILGKNDIDVTIELLANKMGAIELRSAQSYWEEIKTELRNFAANSHRIDPP